MSILLSILLFSFPTTVYHLYNSFTNMSVKNLVNRLYVLYSYEIVPVSMMSDTETIVVSMFHSSSKFFLQNLSNNIERRHCWNFTLTRIVGGFIFIWKAFQHILKIHCVGISMERWAQRRQVEYRKILEK